jgi:hypothetical protein
MNSILESKEFTLDRYRRQPYHNSVLDGMERTIWTIIAILVLVMAAARLDAMIEQYDGRDRAKIAFTHESTKNNPGPVKPISNYTAGVND